MNHQPLDISFEYPDAYTKRIRVYTGKAVMQDAEKGVYLAFDFLDEHKNPPLNFSSEIYLYSVKNKANALTWISPSGMQQKELLKVIGEAIENAVE
jgi:hypothetical protein